MFGAFFVDIILLPVLKRRVLLCVGRSHGARKPMRLVFLTDQEAEVLIRISKEPTGTWAQKPRSCGRFEEFSIGLKDLPDATHEFRLIALRNTIDISRFCFTFTYLSKRPKVEVRLMRFCYTCEAHTNVKERTRVSCPHIHKYRRAYLLNGFEEDQYAEPSPQGIKSAGIGDVFEFLVNYLNISSVALPEPFAQLALFQRGE